MTMKHGGIPPGLIMLEGMPLQKGIGVLNFSTVSREDMLKALARLEDDIRYEGPDIGNFVAAKIAGVAKDIATCPEGDIPAIIEGAFSEDSADTVEARAQRAGDTIMGVLAATQQDLARELEQIRQEEH